MEIGPLQGKMTSYDKCVGTANKIRSLVEHTISLVG